MSWLDGKVTDVADLDFVGGGKLKDFPAGITIGNTRISPVTPTTYGDRVPVTVKVAASGAVRTAGGVAAWANPVGSTIMITGCALDVTTVSSGAATVDIGVAANATTSADTLIDGASTATTARVIDNVKDAGTNGTSWQRMGSTEVVTVSEASGDVTGLVGFLYVTYFVI